jgi:hypothetical protein
LLRDCRDGVAEGPTAHELFDRFRRGVARFGDAIDTILTKPLADR